MCSSSLKSRVEKLEQEFETFGILSSSNNEEFSDKLLNILDSTFVLIGLHRKLLSNITDLELATNNFNKEKNCYWKKIASLGEQITKNENTIKDQTQKIVYLSYENEQFLKQIRELEEINKAFHKRSRENEDLHKHQFKRVLSEKQKFIDQKEKNFDHYVSRDEILFETIEKYKKNEDIYKETINHLQNNNTELLKEIMALKNDVLKLYCKNDDSENESE